MLPVDRPCSLPFFFVPASFYIIYYFVKHPRKKQILLCQKEVVQWSSDTDLKSGPMGDWRSLPQHMWDLTVLMQINNNKLLSNETWCVRRVLVLLHFLRTMKGRTRGILKRFAPIKIYFLISNLLTAGTVL